MNAKRLALATVIALGLTAGGARVASAHTTVAAGVAIGPSGHAGVDVGVFYDDLSPYGRWVDRPSYGRVFLPRVARAGWRPYSLGHWVETDYGWTWISAEPFGWATYHYGRWYLDPDDGWEWVPGTDWGPAWVDFHEGDGYVGWAPLPPSVGFDFSLGVRLGGYSLPPQAYCFVPERRFLEPRVGTFLMAPARNVAIFRNTRNITRYAVVNHRIVNRSLAVDRVAQMTGRRVPRLQVARATRPGERVQGNRVAFFRPTEKRAPVAARTVARRTGQARAPQRAAIARRPATVARRVEMDKRAAAHRANDARQARIQHDRAVQSRRAQTERRQAEVTRRTQEPPHVHPTRVEHSQPVRVERQAQQRERRRPEGTPPPQQRSVERRQAAPRPERQAVVHPQPSNRPPRNQPQGQPRQGGRPRPPRERGDRQGDGH